MKMSIGGSIESASLNGRLFPVAADADAQRKLGGFENEHQSNGDGSGRLIKTRTGWSLSGLTISIDDSRNDQEFLQDLQNMKDYFVIAVTLVSGAVWQGLGQIVEEAPMSTQATTADITLMGPGNLTQQ
jgi:hypothetical protein